ncbi:MAG: prepilin-type cleavage/methylation domain-containing protein [Verrucomicrobia bacterium]|nr:MAG: prepilin-type cleavage/methylation domain-containing protein [Verrucomicrobiota bacterium]
MVELLVVIAMIAILAALLLPALVKARAKAQAIACLSNTRQLSSAWQLYATDHNDLLPYNVELFPSVDGIGLAAATNWASGALNWGLSPDNTNTATLTEASLGPYVGKAAGIYRCPSDRVLSKVQRDAGWNERVRSYSMNAMVGNAGDAMAGDHNKNNPDYVQFFKLSAIPHPEEIFAFLDEHPDSIGDGYFKNRANTNQWLDLPASYHNGAAAFSFSDGHSELHRWKNESTRVPAVPGLAMLPRLINKKEAADYYWVVYRMSVARAGENY